MKLTLGGQLSYHLPGSPRYMEVQLEEPTLLLEVLVRLGIPAAEVYITVVNGELVELPSVRVSQQDEVKLYPPVDGG